jgi:hypothetical protein
MSANDHGQLKASKANHQHSGTWKWLRDEEVVAGPGRCVMDLENGSGCALPAVPAGDNSAKS